MSGPAVFAGTTHQAGVIAFVLVHILAERRLGWLTPTDDTPNAVLPETGGPGDDLAIEFGGGESFEAQAKAGLVGDVALSDAVRSIASRDPTSDGIAVLVVDRRSSSWIYREFATELERIRGGRTDVLVRARVLHEELGPALNRLRVKAVDVTPPDDPEAAIAKNLLAAILVDGRQADAAWAILLEAASDAAARRLRIDRAAAVDILRGRGIEIRVLSPADRALAQLDFVRQLLERRHAASALSILSDFDGPARTGPAFPDVDYGVHRLRATAQLQLGRPGDALASARIAIEIRPNGHEAHVSAAIASLQLGQLDEAREYATRSVGIAPDSDRAWGSVAQVNAALGVDEPQVPPGIATATHYLTVLAENALVRGDFPRAIELIRVVTQRADRRPEALVIGASALLEAGRDPALGELDPSAEAEALASDAIGELDDVNPLKAKALILRAAARRATGDVAGAEADLLLGASLDPDDVDVIRNLVSLKLSSGQADAAIELLHRPASATQASLLAVRARLLFERGRIDEASQDLERARALVSDAPDQDEARFAVADAALEIDDADAAEAVLEGLSETASERAITHVFRARIAFARNDVDRAIAEFRSGAEKAGARRTEFLAELGVQLVRRERYADAIQTFEDADGVLPEEGTRAYVGALMRTGSLGSAETQIAELAEAGPLPPWAIGVSVDIAIASDDSHAAISRLTELADRGHATPHVRIVLAHQLIEADRISEAAPHVDALLAADPLTAEERMQTAELLRELGRGPEAIAQAYEAFRQGRDDPRMQRALAGMVFASRLDIPAPERVGPDTHVQLAGARSETRHHTVLAHEPYRPEANEISLDHARDLQLVDKQVGDTIVEHPGSWSERRWTVTEIVPAVVHYARDVIANFEMRFPNEPFFATAVHVGDGSEPGDYASVIRALGQRRSHVEQALALLREQILPLGAIVRIVGGSINDLLDLLIFNQESELPYWIEWEDQRLHAWSLDQAREAAEVILTRSSVRTVFDRGLMAELSQGYQLVAPTSLLSVLRSEVDEARDQVEHGRSTMYSGDRGIGIDEVPAHDPRLADRLTQLERVLAWVEGTATVVPRPLDWIKPEDTESTSLRQTIGASDYDAMVLAYSRDAALYADDLGLRRLALKDERAPSFSSATLFPVLAERGVISPRQRDEALVTLAARNCLAILPTPEFLLTAMDPTMGLNAEAVGKVFSHLWRPNTTPLGSANTIALACRHAASQAIQTIEPARVAQLGLEASRGRIPSRLAAMLVARAAQDQLRLLPIHLAGVRQVCSEFT